MSSTGNDIVALDTINIARTLQSRFYTKILSAAEIAQYHESGLTQMPFERYVWMLWSIKESAFKFLQRYEPKLVFSPTKFIVTQLDIPFKNGISPTEGSGFEDSPACKGIVTMGSNILYSRSLMNEKYIFSVVNDKNDFENIHWGIKSIHGAEPDRQSAEVRRFVMNKINKLLPYDDLSIAKNQHGCPILLSSTQQTDISVSLAHHGHYIGYSFSTGNCLAY